MPKNKIETKKVFLRESWGEGKELRVTTTQIGDKVRPTIREWYKDANDNWAPGKGVSLFYENLPGVIKALQQILEED